MDLAILFHDLVSLSLLGSLLAVGLFLIKLLFRQKLSATWHYYIWFVLILRLIIPSTLPIPFSVFNLLPQHLTTVHVSQAFSQPSVSTTPSPSDANTISAVPASFGSEVTTQISTPLYFLA